MDRSRTGAVIHRLRSLASGYRGLLRYRAGRDGVRVYEATPGVCDRFRYDAARFWCDAEPVLRPAYEAVLERIG